MDVSQFPSVVGQTIDTIASKLQVPAEKILDVGINGIRLDGLISLVEFIILAILTFICFRRAEKADSDSRYGWRIGGGLLFFLTLLALELGSRQFFMPEYALLKMILKF